MEYLEYVFSQIPIVLILSFLFSISFNKHRKIIPSNPIPLLIKANWLFFAIFFLLAGLSYLTFETAYLDTWIINQSFWNTLHGSFFYNNYGNEIYFSDHASFIYLLILPFYAIYQSPLLLYFIQIFCVGLGSFAIFKLSLLKFSPENSFLIAISYLFYPPLQFTILREFHQITLIIPLFLFLFYFIENNKHNLITLFSFLALIVKENVGFTLAMLSIYFTVFKSEKYLILALVSILFSIISIFFISPYFTGGQYQFFDFYKKGNIIPIKIDIAYLLTLFLPIGGLAIFSPSTLLIALPSFFQNIFSNSLKFHTIFNWYDSLIVPFIFISSIYGIENISIIIKKYFIIDSKNYLVSFLFVSSIVSTFFFISPLNPSIFNSKTYIMDNNDMIVFNSFKLIEPSGSVASNGLFIGQLSSRKLINYSEDYTSETDYILEDITKQSNANKGLTGSELEQLINEGSYYPLVKKNGVYLLKKVD